MQTETPPARYRLRFEKRGPARFYSHKDLMRIFERSGRRADLPLAMTRGFNPHPVLSIPLALKVGMEGLDEAVEIDLSEPLGTADLVSAVDRTLPAGLRVTGCETLPAGRRRPVRESRWRVGLDAKNPEVRDALGRLGGLGAYKSAADSPWLGDVRCGPDFVSFSLTHVPQPPPSVTVCVTDLLGPGPAARARYTRTAVVFEQKEKKETP
jgi:hypothetical protein